jgi:hypothetical protein
MPNPPTQTTKMTVAAADRKPNSYRLPVNRRGAGGPEREVAMRFTVRAVIICTIGAVLSIVLGVQLALAACTTNAQCPSNQTCQNSPIPGIKECKALSCNFSFRPGSEARSDVCPSDRPSCTYGFCIAPASGGGTGGGGAGIPQSDVGQACGEVNIGQVTKSVGCKAGLQCVKVPPSSKSGTCQKPLQ